LIEKETKEIPVMTSLMASSDGENNHYCPACNFPQSSVQGRKNGFNILSCRNCDTWYTSCLPDCTAAQDYDEYYSPQNLVTPDFVSRRLDEIVATFSTHRQNNRLLDVGFGAGDLLRAAVRANWDAEGTEVSRPAVEYAHTLGLNVHRGELSETKYPDDYFDVVTAVEVLEHVPDPQHLIQEIARILRPGGLLWATTPHGRGISARVLKLQWSVVSPPEHLQLLSSKGARALLAASGFRATQVITQGTNPYEILHELRRQRTVRLGQQAGEALPHDDSVASNTFSRNETGFQLNEFLISSPSRRALKTVLNGLLNISRLGDSLKIRAVL
jgi:2-polyprenyl-3-methyl-5-hydroxy-6-metoxy-1,4-benzoquinol methylase